MLSASSLVFEVSEWSPRSSAPAQALEAIDDDEGHLTARDGVNLTPALQAKICSSSALGARGGQMSAKGQERTSLMRTLDVCLDPKS